MHASPKREEPMSERKPFFAEAVAFAVNRQCWSTGCSKARPLAE
jgi:hypothetical protein